MKHAEKNEFDLLLRALAKRERVSGLTAAGKQEPATEHLDADELSSYAEDVLPSAARARYTAHLADCESCRKIVTQLTLATGATVRRGVVEKAPSTSFWQKLAVLFSPAVLRYAGPALAVFAVVAISFVVLRQQQESAFVARNEQPSAANESVATQETMQQDKREGYIASQPESETASPAPRQQPPTTIAKDAQQPAQKTGQEGQAAGDTANVAADANTAKPTGESQRTYAPEPATVTAAPPPAQPKASAGASVGAVAVRQSEDKEREKAAKDDGAGAKREDARRREGNEVTSAAEDQTSANKMQGLPTAARNTRGLRKNEESDADKKAKSSVATRSVGGRQFRREDNAWIDTAYNSSRPLVNVRRGSEQYRALLADESGLRNIVDALDGTVIVVWKGRAYRFQ